MFSPPLSKMKSPRHQESQSSRLFPLQTRLDCLQYSIAPKGCCAIKVDHKVMFGSSCNLIIITPSSLNKEYVDGIFAHFKTFDVLHLNSRSFGSHLTAVCRYLKLVALKRVVRMLLMPCMNSSISF